MTRAIAAFCLLILLPLLAHAQVFVRADATGANNGTSWADAYTDLQPALSTATPGTEIWVAAGTFKPTSGGDRTATFSLAMGVSVYGGFAGTETTLSERNIGLNPTYLSGEIGAPGLADNSYHVVTGTGVDATAVLDGFIVTMGNANGSGVPFATYGGGMYNNHGSPTLANLTFQSNEASNGAGMANLSSSPTLTGANFLFNDAVSGGAVFNNGGAPELNWVYYSFNTALLGGAIYNDGASPTIANSIFSANSSSDEGGAIACYGTSQPNIEACLFEFNTATGDGGAIYCADGRPTIDASTFSFNTSSSAVLHQGRGGAIAAFDCPSVCVTNCVFEGNQADLFGGGLAAFRSDVTITNDTFAGNTLLGSPSTPEGGAIYAYETSGSITNTISWGNFLNEFVCVGPAVPIYSYSLMEVAVIGGTDGGNNLFGANPLFDANLALTSTSPAINVGSNSAPKITLRDRAGNLRVASGVVDLGAFEYNSTTAIPPVIATHAATPEIHSLYPNPFNPTVTFDFEVPQAGDVSVDVYDVAGRRLRTISRGHRTQGPHQARWDAKSDRGTQVASGVYWLVVTSENGRAQRKMTLLK